jgi:spermidine/putrescine transport system permease protein
MAISLKSDSAKGYALSAPAVAYVGFLVVVPICLMIANSFWTQDYIEINRDFTLDNYREAFSDPLIGILLVRSVVIAGLVTILTVLTAYPIAYYIAFKTQRKALWLMLVTIPFWSSYLLRVFAWKLILGYNGVLNSGLLAIGVIDEPLDFILYNPNAVVLTLAHAWAPFAILPIYVSLQKIDPSLLEAATDLGSTAIERFRRVTLPLSIPGVIAASLIIFIPTVGDYVTPALVGGSDGKMIANMIQVMFGPANNWPLGAALSILAMLAVMFVAVAFVLAMQGARRAIK